MKLPAILHDALPRCAPVSLSESPVRALFPFSSRPLPTMRPLPFSFAAVVALLAASAHHYLGPNSKTLPSTVCVNRPTSHGNGYFPAAHAPLAILDPDEGLANAAAHVSPDIQTTRLGLLSQLDASFGPCS